MIICIILSILFVPSLAEAWGPLTHVYLANQILDLGVTAIPATLYGLLKKYRKDFLYGNISADIILGRRFQGKRKHSHSWDIAWQLLDGARTEPQRAFAYGYLTHLCADTVAHNLDPSLPFTHPALELKSDSLIDKRYRKMLKRLDKPMQRRNDKILEKRLESVFFTFKTNRRIFKSFLVLSRIPSYTPVSNFIDRRLPYEIPVRDIYTFQHESLKRMFELLIKGKKSNVMKKNPIMRYRKAS